MTFVLGEKGIEGLLEKDIGKAEPGSQIELLSSPITDEKEYRNFLEQNRLEGCGPDFVHVLRELMENSILHGGGLKSLKLQTRERGYAVLLIQQNPLPEYFDLLAKMAEHVGDRGGKILANYVTEVKERVGMVLMHLLKEVKIAPQGNVIAVYKTFK